MKKTIFGMIVCAALCACTSENDELGGGKLPMFEGDKAYITVRLCDVGSNGTMGGNNAATRATDDVVMSANEATRAAYEAMRAVSETAGGNNGATRATEGGFGSSLSEESGVSNAYFYFFDADGVLVSEGEVWKGEMSDNTSNENVDFTSGTEVILKGLTERNYPKYVVTVLNKPVDFAPGETLGEFEKQLSMGDASGIKAGNNFIMSTTSFADQYSADNAKMKIPYFVTELSERDFHLEPITDLQMNDPVNIYVERLASKVTVNLGSDMQDNAVKAIEGDITHYLYEVDETVAGDENTDDQDGMAVDKLYVELLGWKLNATARNSNMVKNINEEWKNSSKETDYNLGQGWTWNDPDNKRSYWGMSYNYDIKYEYKSNSEGNTPENEKNADTWVNKYLQYVSLKGITGSPLLGFGSHDYCAENTNTAQNSTSSNNILKYKYSPAITSVLLKARVCTLGADGNSIETQTLVRYKGELFTEKGYLDYVIKHLMATKGLNAYYLASENSEIGEKTYKHIDNQFVELKKLRDVPGYGSSEANIDGYYAVVPNGKFTSTTLYQKVEDGTFEEISDKSSQSGLFDVFNEDAEAIGYANGLMYYNIPIEHINANYDYQDNGAGQSQTQLLNEANYGIVRNHHYVVTITSVKNLGKGIVDENEVIVPDPKDYLDTYYVGAEINILPWKVVVQNVEI